MFRFRPLTGEVLRTYPSLQAAADELEVLPPHVEQAAMWGHALPGFTFVRFGTTQGPRFGSWQLLTADHLRILCPGLSAAEVRAARLPLGAAVVCSPARQLLCAPDMPWRTRLTKRVRLPRSLRARPSTRPRCTCPAWATCGSGSVSGACGRRG